MTPGPIVFRSSSTRQPSASATFAVFLSKACALAFRRHARYCARHQVRVLLLCSLFITSLFYPAVGIYFWSSKGGPGVSRGDPASVWRSLSTPLMDSFASSGRKHHNTIRDLRMIWDDATDLRAIDVRDAVNLFSANPTPAHVVSHTIFPFTAWTEGQSQASEEEGTQRKERPRCRTVRIEHVFVTTDDIMSGSGGKYGALEVPILSSALQLQNAIEEAVSGHSNSSQSTFASRIRCVQPLQADDTGDEQQRACLSLSPLEYWQSDRALIQADTAPERTPLSADRPLSKSGAMLSIYTTLAGRWHLFNKLPRAEHLAFTFFVEEPSDDQCSPIRDYSESEFSGTHRDWLNLLKEVTAGQVNIVSAEHREPKELLLQFKPRLPGSTIGLHQIILGGGYVALFIYVLRGVLSTRKVHSRFGLALTGCVELIVSMVLSISICALLGIRLTLVPWEILPFVIVVIGSENMSVLIHAIVNTPVSLKVPSRIAQGLSKVGVPITVTVLSDVVLLTGIASLITVQAVREFCIFAICSLLMDYIMQMTFFITILSIDMQRLELADLLTQGGNSGFDSTPQQQPRSRQDPNDMPPTPRSFIKTSFRALWRARTARTASLSLLLAFMFGLYLYYGTGYPSSMSYTFGPSTPAWMPVQQTTGAVQQAADLSAAAAQVASSSPHAFDPLAHLDGSASLATTNVPWWSESPSAVFWQTLNPYNAPQIRLLVEPWTILSLRSAEPQKGKLRGPSFAGWALFRPRIRAIIWFAKLVVLPIAGTTALLWMLLLYLLKDADLLALQHEKQRGRNETDNEDDNTLSPLASEAELAPELSLDVVVHHTGHRSDVHLLAESDGAVFSADVGSSLSVRRDARKPHDLVTMAAAEDLGGASVTALALSKRSNFLASGFSDGAVRFVALSNLKAFTSGSVTSVLPANDTSPQPQSRPESRVQLIVTHSRPPAPDVQAGQINLVSAHQDGSLWEWIPGTSEARNCVPARPHSTWNAFEVSTLPLGEAHDTPQGPLMPYLALVSPEAGIEVYYLGPDGTSTQIFATASTAGVSYRSAAVIPFGRSNGAGTSTVNRPSSLVDLRNRTVGSFTDAVQAQESTSRQGLLQGHSRSTSTVPTEVAQLIIVGTSTGLVQVWDPSTCQVLSAIEVRDGPVAALSLVSEGRGTGSDAGSVLVVASSTTSESIIRIRPEILISGNTPSPDATPAVPPMPSPGLERPTARSGASSQPPLGVQLGLPSKSAGNSLLADSNLPAPSSDLSTSLHPPTINGISHTSSEPPFLSTNGTYRRRHSNQGPRSRQGSDAAGSSGLGFNAAEDGSLARLIGRITTQRGGAQIVRGSVLLGIRRKGSGGSAGSGQSYTTTAFGGPSPSSPPPRLSSTFGDSARWEVWAIDLLRDLDVAAAAASAPARMTRDRELLVRSQHIDLDMGDETQQSSRRNGGNSLRRRGPGKNGNGDPSSGASSSGLTLSPLGLVPSHDVTALAFTRIHPLRASTDPTGPLLIGCGNAIARLRLVYLAPLPGAVTPRDARDGSARTSRRRENGSVATVQWT